MTFFQGVTNISIFEYHQNSWTEQQYSVFGIQIFPIPNSIWYSVFIFFLTPNIIWVFEQFDRIPVQKVSHIFRTKGLVWNKYLYFSLFFPKKFILFGIQYSVFEKLDPIVLFVFGIWIFLIPNSIRYSVFGFWQYQIVFNIWYSVISENPIIFGICIRSKKGICHTLVECREIPTPGNHSDVCVEEKCLDCAKEKLSFSKVLQKEDHKYIAKLYAF